MRGSKFISVNNFSAQEHASSKNRHILNFRAVAVRDVKLWTCLPKKYIHVSRFLAFLEVKVLAYLNVCLIISDQDKSPR